MAATVPRTPITSLRPLTQQQIDYLRRFGAVTAMNYYMADTVWWYKYFAQPDDSSIPFNDWDQPGLDVSNKRAFLLAAESLNQLLAGARTNRQLARKLVSDGLYPPDQGANPYALPPYFIWWQTENAFRRGFMEKYEEAYLDVFKERLRTVFHNDGNILTQSSMEELAEEYKRDPFIELYFTALAQDIEQNKPPTFSGLKALYQDMLRRRAYGYQQFSPYFVALRWAPGAGLVGLEQR